MKMVDWYHSTDGAESYGAPSFCLSFLLLPSCSVSSPMLTPLFSLPSPSSLTTHHRRFSLLLPSQHGESPNPSQPPRYGLGRGSRGRGVVGDILEGYRLVERCGAGNGIDLSSFAVCQAVRREKKEKLLLSPFLSALPSSLKGRKRSRWLCEPRDGDL
jgi:hypothetical protein